MGPLKYLSNFWITLETALINCEVNFIFTSSVDWLMVSTNNANQGATLAVTEIKLYIPVVTLWTQIIQNYYSN